MRIHTEIDIRARPERVWEILANTGAYPEWNPLIRRFAGELRAGRMATIHLSVGRAAPRVKVEILAAAPSRELRWIGPGNPIARRWASGEHYHIIDDQGDGTVRLRHGEVFEGFLVPRAWSRIERALVPAYEAFNHAVKARAEA